MSLEGPGDSDKERIVFDRLMSAYFASHHGGIQYESERSELTSVIANCRSLSFICPKLICHLCECLFSLPCRTNFDLIFRQFGGVAAYNFILCSYGLVFAYLCLVEFNSFV